MVKHSDKEYGYMSTLKWNDLMRYLKNTYGKEYQEEFEMKLTEEMGDAVQNNELDELNSN